MEHQGAPDKDTASILLRVFEERMAESLKADEEMDFEAQQGMLQTQKITQKSAYAAFILTPVIFLLIGTLVLDMGTITERMGVMSDDVAAMNQDFDKISELMRAMESSTVNMSQNISVIPLMDIEITEINADFSGMVHAMNKIAPEVAEIDGLLNFMESNMARMNSSFSRMNHNVLSMGRDVDTMSSPMRMMPFMSR